jgi:lipopolysaccharide heptosyltransferase II
VLLFSLKFLGWLLAHTPEPLLRALSAALGDFLFFCLPRRRRLVLANLHHAFPEKSAAWHRSIGRESCRRMIETALLSLATPYLNESRLRQIVSVSPEMLAAYELHRTDPAATLICSPHLAYWEAQTSQPLVVPGPFPEFGIIFRPLDNPAANDFVTRSRERFGMKLLSRKEGFAEALKILRRRGFVGVLFDQNAGLQGALTTLFGRVCSTTELPGLMAEKFSARVYGIFPRRRAFWRVEVGAELIATGGTTESVTLALNRWLETLLFADDNLCASWLWAHDRWRNQDMPQKRFRLEAKRDLLAADLAARNLPALPRRTRLYVRLPNWLGDVVMALPLLRALRASRPDAEITLVAKKQFLPLLDGWSVADRTLALPPQGLGYYLFFFRLRSAYPDAWLLFTNSVRGDLEAWLSGCRQRFGLVRPGKLRPLLSHAYRVPADYDESTHHQLELWENFLRHFGLNAPPDRTPLAASISDAQLSVLSSPLSAPPPLIGLIPGSENTPAKRWPVDHWRALIETFPGAHFILFGTVNDAPLTAAIAAGFPPARIENLAGRTTLPDYCARLRTCRVLVTNDTGGMHLANALGVPLLALFGPTNPLRTGPVFTSPTRLLQPPGCPPTGGGHLTDLTPATVATALRERLDSPTS